MFLYIIKKRGFDVSAFITALYSVSSFFSILLLQIEPFHPSRNSIDFIPTLIYCVLLTCFIIPIYNFDVNKIKIVRFRSNRFIHYLTYYYFICFVVMLLAYWKDMFFCLTFPDVAELRKEIYSGELSSYATKYSFPISWIITFFGFGRGLSLIMIFVFFYSLIYLKKKRGFYIMAFLGSLPKLMDSILQIDRSGFLYWGVVFGLCTVMFWKHMNEDIKNKISKLGLVVGVLLVLYLSNITVSRFSERDTGAKGGIISYAGQSYPNFCRFFNDFDNVDGITLKMLCPVTHAYVLKDYSAAVALQGELDNKTGWQTGVFYTHLGSFILSDGKAGPFIITIAFLLLTKLVFRRRGNYISFEHLFISIILIMVPTLGFILYPFDVASTVLFIYILSFLVLNIKDKSIYCKRN